MFNVQCSMFNVFCNFVAKIQKTKMKQDVIISQNLPEDLHQAIERCPHDKLFVLTDTTTLQLCWPVIQNYPYLQEAKMITIGATDENKTLQTLSSVWEALQQGGATRHSLLICLGGGMVTDLGGFAASTFKRGIQYINIPTTLLSMVDASSTAPAQSSSAPTSCAPWMPTTSVRVMPRC